MTGNINLAGETVVEYTIFSIFMVRDKNMSLITYDLIKLDMSLYCHYNLKDEIWHSLKYLSFKINAVNNDCLIELFFTVAILIQIHF